jgi:lysophospholipase L1-like esterase
MWANSGGVRRWWCAALAFVAASMVLAAATVWWADVYLAIADRVRWRFGLPSVAQVQLESILNTVYLRGDGLVGADTTVMFGDSHLHGLPSAAAAAKVANYAIAGEPAARLARRLPQYASVQRARQVLFITGSNDLASGASPREAVESIEAAMRFVPPATPLLLVEAPPLRAADGRVVTYRLFNTELAGACQRRQHCHLVKLSGLADDAGLLAQPYASADGVHLTAAGYKVLADALNAALGPVPQKN